MAPFYAASGAPQVVLADDAGVVSFGVGVVAVGVEAPLPDVAAHLEQTDGVGRPGADRVRHAGRRFGRKQRRFG